MNLFAELEQMHQLAAAVEPRNLLRSATVEGARALGFDADFGTLSPGKLAAMTAVNVPATVTDVEAHLVSGITHSEIAGVMIGAAPQSWS
jgi:cytosine/adenosine deaminase-related metal-dependent hydrolase